MNLNPKLYEKFENYLDYNAINGLGKNIYYRNFRVWRARVLKSEVINIL